MRRKRSIPDDELRVVGPNWLCLPMTILSHPNAIIVPADMA